MNYYERTWVTSQANLPTGVLTVGEDLDGLFLPEDPPSDDASEGLLSDCKIINSSFLISLISFQNRPKIWLPCKLIAQKSKMDKVSKF